MGGKKGKWAINKIEQLNQKKKKKKNINYVIKAHVDTVDRWIQSEIMVASFCKAKLPLDFFMNIVGVGQTCNPSGNGNQSTTNFSRNWTSAHWKKQIDILDGNIERLQE